MAKDVKIIIEMAKPIGNIGFGCPLILEEHATQAVAYKEVTSLADVITAGFAATTKVYKAAQLMFMQAHAPEKIAVCAATTAAKSWLETKANVSKGWRQLVVVNETTEDSTATKVADIMAAVEAETTYPKFYYANLDENDTTTLTVTGMKRTLLCYYTPTESIPSPVAAIAGEVAGLTVGSYTINNLVITGVPALDLSDTDIKAIHDKGGVTMVLSAGDCVVSEGKAAGGSYVDNTDGNDYIRQQLEYKTQKVLNNNLKVPYTNVGIAMLESAALDVMADATNKGIIESYEVNYLLREEVAESDREARKYVGGNIKYSMAGAIHEVEIYCEATL